MIYETGLNETIKTLTTKEETKTLATASELKTEQEKIVKLQAYDSSLFIDQSYYNNHGAQLYLIFQPIYRTITTFSGLKDIISEWESKELSKEKFTCAYVANVSVFPKLIWMNNAKLRSKFIGSCL